MFMKLKITPNFTVQTEKYSENNGVVRKYS